MGRVQVLMAKVTERVEGSYEVQEMEFSRIYKWYPGYLVLECECGERLSLSAYALRRKGEAI